MPNLNPSNVTWLERLTASVPGYSGYEVRYRRQSAAFALRDVLVRRLDKVRTHLDEIRRTFQERGLITTETAALDRVEGFLDRLTRRIQGVGTRAPVFYEAPDINTSEVGSIYEIEHELVDQSERIINHFESPNEGNDLLADVQADLNRFEGLLDERVRRLQALSATDQAPPPRPHGA